MINLPDENRCVLDNKTNKQGDMNLKNELYQDIHALILKNVLKPLTLIL